jgi:hypothetical protein
MYSVFQNGKEIGTGTLTECFEYVATTLSQFHPEQVTVKQAEEDGYTLRKK